ncbi:hypothetical protein, partial [Muricoccus vinaceus]
RLSRGHLKPKCNFHHVDGRYRLSRAGKRVRLVDSPFEQPLGRRSTAQVWPLSWRIVAAFPVRDAMMLGLWLLGWTSGTTVWRGNTLPLAAKGGMADGRAEAAGST